ncbi:HDIG domain-containing protein [Pseudobutyrivibrio sp. YE44]|uniref:HD domain-containing protein n=1 Tax=Pseudobutyrivibrio sp. YE44 TaxID=1520802 RepID=UPI00088A7AF2|nr:HD domain-containing protein [Pseudobutyrivibrio sp. YE44]SDB31444.1 HDIG domain-containing protein [Pseudobutyrivibrio sp. YE44]
MIINEQKVKAAFASYTKNFNPEDPKIALKISHTYRVAENSRAIASSLNMSEDDIEIAWLIGMLHDIGRFEQIERYGTFNDSQSVDHGDFGADLLFKEGLIRNYIDVRDYDAIIETAIRQHNKYRVCEGLNSRTEQFAHIIRDADKVDIFRVQVEEPIIGIYGVPLEEIQKEFLSDAVFEQFKEHTAILRELKKCHLDYYVGHFSLAFELVYPCSRKLTKEQGYLEQLMELKVEDPKTQERIDFIRAEINSCLE